MSRIKTREKVRDIKLLDRSAIAGQRMREAFIRTRDRATGADEQSTPNEYAGDTVQAVAGDVVRDMGRGTVSGKRSAAELGRQAFQRQRAKKAREKMASVGQNTASEASKEAVTGGSHIQQGSDAEVKHQTVLSKPTVNNASHTVEQGRSLTIRQAAKRAETAQKSRLRSQYTGPRIKTRDSVIPPPDEIKQASKVRAVKPAQRGIKTAQASARVSIKTADAAKVTQRTAQTSARATQAARRAGKKARTAAKATAKAVRSIVKMIISGTKALVAAIAGGGWIAVIAVVIICLVGLLAGSCFGVFFSAEDSGTGMTMPDAVAQINSEFFQRIEQIKTENPHDILDGDVSSVANWPEVLAVYAVKVTTSDDAQEAATMDGEKLELLRGVFWDMNEISYSTSSASSTDAEGNAVTIVTLHISVRSRTAGEMADGYGFDEKQREQLSELLSPEYAGLFTPLIGSNQSLTLSPEEVRDILSRLPRDLSEDRRQVVLTAYQLLGKVNYFWGGKSLTIGWDSRWGTPARVTAPGSSSTGTVRPFGLDCSGFVDWAFFNASNGAHILGQGYGTYGQHANCRNVSWSQVLPGDIVFYPSDSHVGIVCGFDEHGNVLIIHCSSGYNNVVVTGRSGFVTAARPRCYGD